MFAMHHKIIVDIECHIVQHRQTDSYVFYENLGIRAMKRIALKSKRWSNIQEETNGHARRGYSSLP